MYFGFASFSHTHKPYYTRHGTFCFFYFLIYISSFPYYNANWLMVHAKCKNTNNNIITFVPIWKFSGSFFRWVFCNIYLLKTLQNTFHSRMVLLVLKNKHLCSYLTYNIQCKCIVILWAMAHRKRIMEICNGKYMKMP